MYSSDHLVLRWGKNIWFIELTDRWQALLSVSKLCCLFVTMTKYITGQNYWSNCLVSLRPDDGLFIFSLMFGLKPSQFLSLARNLTEHFPAWSTRLSERWEGWGRGGWMSRIPHSVQVSAVRCHWRMLAFNSHQSGQDIIFSQVRKVDWNRGEISFLGLITYQGTAV